MGIVVGMYNGYICICRLLCNLHRRIFYKLRNIDGTFNFIARKFRKFFVRSGKVREFALITRRDCAGGPALWVRRRIKKHQ